MTLTEKQRTVVVHICEGMDTKEVAEELQIGERTVYLRLQEVYKAHGIKNRVQLMNAAIAAGIVTPKEECPGADTTEANDESRDEMTQESRMSPDNTCSSVAPTSGDKAS